MTFGPAILYMQEYSVTSAPYRSFFETDHQEAMRLATHPAGSREQKLSRLPVTMHDENPRNTLVKLPTEMWANRHIIVFVKNGTPHGTGGADRVPYPRTHTFTCAVVSSTHPLLQVGCKDLEISHVELRRGTKVDLNPVSATPRLPH